MATAPAPKSVVITLTKTITAKHFATIACFSDKPYNAFHIRPLAVSPLNHSESVPTPWGFLISRHGFCLSSDPAQERSA